MTAVPRPDGRHSRDDGLSGILAFPLTSFDADLSLDLTGSAESIERHIGSGATAVFVGCGTGEGGSLSGDERRALWARAREVTRGRVPLWVGVGGGDARDGLRAAADAGADGALLLPPYLAEGPALGTVDYARWVTAGARIPVVVYHRGAAVLSPQSAVALLDLPNVIGLKDGVGSIDLMSRIVTAIRTSGHPRADDFLFFNGLPTAEVSARAYAAIDVVRYSSAVHCFAPGIANAFHAALRAGDGQSVDVLLERFFLPLVALRDEGAGYAVSLVKAGAAAQGHRVGPVRPPLVMPRPDQIDRLADIVSAGERALRERAIA